MDLNKLEEHYTQFQSAAETGFQLLNTVIEKMNSASENGNTQAGEWAQDLQKISSTLQSGQGHIGEVLQQLHSVLTLVGQENTETEEGHTNNTTSSFISGVLNSDLGKTLESGSFDKIGEGLLNKFLK